MRENMKKSWWTLHMIYAYAMRFNSKVSKSMILAGSPCVNDFHPSLENNRGDWDTLLFNLKEKWWRKYVKGSMSGWSTKSSSSQQPQKLVLGPTVVETRILCKPPGLGSRFWDNNYSFVWRRKIWSRQSLYSDFINLKRSRSLKN